MGLRGYPGIWTGWKMPAMSDAPILAEVRAIRDKLAAECGYDVKEIFRRVRQCQVDSGAEYVALRTAAGGSRGRRGGGSGDRRRCAGR